MGKGTLMVNLIEGVLDFGLLDWGVGGWGVEMEDGMRNVMIFILFFRGLGWRFCRFDEIFLVFLNSRCTNVMNQ